MGDGGIILQVMDSEGDVIAVTNDSWRCLVVHKAPLDKNCEQAASPVAGEGYCRFTQMDHPIGWDLSEFDDSGWKTAQVYSERDVRPKDGYDRVSWSGEAALIRGPDLETDNTLLCRLTVN